MQVVITAVGPDNKGLADPIVHYVTGVGANIHEIQMYDRDDEHLFAMLLRIEIGEHEAPIAKLRSALTQIGGVKGLSIRVWSRDETGEPPRIAICTTYRPEPAAAVLAAIRSGDLKATPAVVIGNRKACAPVAREFDVPFEFIGDGKGNPLPGRLDELIDQHNVDYVALARYMRVLSPRTCWQFAGGRIINLHHGLLPPYPGFRPYTDAYAHNMLAYGATAHFIIPELDAGNQIINQSTFSVAPGTPLDEVRRHGETVNEPECLVEGLRRVIDREVELHFQRVITTKPL